MKSRLLRPAIAVILLSCVTSMYAQDWLPPFANEEEDITRRGRVSLGLWNHQSFDPFNYTRLLVTPYVNTATHPSSEAGMIGHLQSGRFGEEYGAQWIGIGMFNQGSHFGNYGMSIYRGEMFSNHFVETTSGNVLLQWGGDMSRKMLFQYRDPVLPDPATLMSFQYNGTEGYIGVGLDPIYNATERLDINGRLRVRTIDEDASQQATRVLLADNDGVVQFRDINTLGGGQGGQDADWAVNGNNMTSIPTGNVGIGTTTPNARLHVNGAIRAAGLPFGQTTLPYWTDLETGFFTTIGSDGGGLFAWDQDAPLNDHADLVLYYGDDHNVDLRIIKTSWTGSEQIFTDVMTFKANQLVGINTTDPTERLDVNGSLRVRNITQDDNLDNFLVADANGVIHYRTVNSLGGSEYWALNGNNLTPIPSGNVGIGVSTPLEKLEVNGNFRLSNSSGISTIKTGLLSNELNLYVANDAIDSPTYIEMKNNGNGEGNLKLAGTSVDFYYNTNNTSRGDYGMSLKSTGQLVIGNVAGLDTDSDVYKLFVEKGIRTELLRVDLQGDWSDYVFEDDYELKSIAEVQDYVKTYKHLPGMPSAAEVGEKGINVAEMDALLLRQLEEIWLHLMELQEENEALKAEVEHLKSK